MDAPTALPLPQPSLGALMVSLGGVMAVATVLLVYHLITTKLCAVSVQQTNFSRATGNSDDTEQKGINEEVLSSIPILSYTGSKKSLFRIDQTDCAVCLGELQEGDMVRLLLACRHAFHVQCIDEWFVGHSNCPICRTEMLTVLVDTHMASNTMTEEEAITQVVAQSDINAGPSNSQIGSKALPNRCVSLLSLDRPYPLSSFRKLNRSLSMDYSPQVPILKSMDLEHGHPVESQQYATPFGLSSGSISWRRGSFKWLDTGPLLLRSPSRLRTASSRETLPM